MNKRCEYCGDAADGTHESQGEDFPTCGPCRAQIEAEDREHWSQVTREIEYIAGLPEVPPW